MKCGHRRPAWRSSPTFTACPAQRFYNLVCIGYGADTEYFADVVKKGYLPESRAEGCEDEYKQVDYAYRKLIGPYVDRSVRRKIKPEQHLTPDVYK